MLGGPLENTRLIPIQQVALIDELPCRRIDPVEKVLARVIAFLDRQSRIAGALTLGTRGGERDIRPREGDECVGISLVGMRELPAGVGGQGDFDLRMTDAGGLVAIGVATSA